MIAKSRNWTFFLGLMILLTKVDAHAQKLPEKLEERIFNPKIKSVLLYPDIPSPSAVLEPAITFLKEGATPLTLEFDDLSETYHTYYFKLIPCNWDWTPARLNDLEFLDQFNEYVIQDYQLGQSPRVSYYHYSARVPATKLSGNYALWLYVDNDPDKVQVIRRFVVVDSKLMIEPDIRFPLDPNLRFISQQIDFKIRYGGVDLFNINDMLHVVIRQNQRWDNAKTQVKPIGINEADRTLDYHLFDNTNVFAGLNEYRQVDIRSLRFAGLGVKNIQFNNNGANVDILEEGSRNQPNYTQWFDANGRYIIQNLENREGHIAAEYINVTFHLKPKNKISGDVYVFGHLSDWRTDPDFKMTWDVVKGAYSATLSLKQGIYNYAYVVQPDTAQPNRLDEVQLEGSYNMTENQYDWIVYFRPIGSRHDHAIGYTATKWQGR